MTERYPKRLIITARKLDRGGSERQIVLLAERLIKEGYDVRLVLMYAGGDFDNELIEKGIPIYFINKLGRWDVIGFSFRLITTLRSLKPDIIYSFLDLPNIISVILSPITRRPRLVWSIRSTKLDNKHFDCLNKLISWLEALFSKYADVIISNSQAGKDWGISRGFPESKISVIENGIDTQIFIYNSSRRDQIREEWNISSDQILVGNIARIHPMKDHYTFLKSCALLANLNEHFRFICVGDGLCHYKHQLESYAFELGISERLIWAGLRTDMPSVFSALDVVVSSSAYGEGFSNSIAEAMACERPCVVTDVGDSARIVGNIGKVVAPGNAQMLADAILEVTTTDKYDAMVRLSMRSKIIKEFSVQSMVEKTKVILFEDIYESAIHNKQFGNWWS